MTAVAFGGGLILVLLVGCASPGPPLPPSLKLPEVVAAAGLVATRAGDEVTLRWTTPSHTTDKLPIAGPIAAEICRETLAAMPSSSAMLATGTKSAAQGKAPTAQNPRQSAATAPCSPVLRVLVSPGTSEVVDTLPASLTTEPARLLAYRVQLLNAAGRTAGPSPVVFAASGPAPQPVADLRGRATKSGVVLEWRPEASGAEVIELDRTAAEPVSAAGAGRMGGIPGSPKEPVESRFRAGKPDSGAGAGGAGEAGGTIDRSAQIGHVYRYTAQRVRSVILDGQTLEVRSLPSVLVTVAVKDVFPPDAPVGLVAVPGFIGATSVGATAAQAQRPTIDLSWEPNLEPRIAGYRVYRADLDGDARDRWTRLGSELVPVAAYRDPTVVAGRRYDYRVTAVNEAGNESGPSEAAAETAPTP